MSAITSYEVSAPDRTDSRAISNVFVFCLFWSLTATISFLVDILFWHKVLDSRQILFVAFVAAAAFITAAIAWSLEQNLIKNKPLTARFAAIFILLSIGTMGATCLFSTLYTMRFFWPVMEPLTTLNGMSDLIFFFLTHGYSFAVSTARLFLPLGFISLVMASLFYCILSRR